MLKLFVGASPFVVALKLAGINVLPDILNGAILVFTVSASSTGKSRPQKKRLN